MQDIFLELEKEMEEVSSQLHNAKWLKIVKISGRDNSAYPKGSYQEGFCKGIEIGKCVYLAGRNGRWFITTPVQSINIQDNTFNTMNSTYKYHYNEKTIQG